MTNGKIGMTGMNLGMASVKLWERLCLFLSFPSFSVMPTQAGIQWSYRFLLPRNGKWKIRNDRYEFRHGKREIMGTTLSFSVIPVFLCHSRASGNPVVL